MAAIPVVTRRLRDADRDSKILRDIPSKLHWNFDSVASEIDRGLDGVRHHRKQNTYRVERVLPRRPPAWVCEGQQFECDLGERKRRYYRSILPTFDGTSTSEEFQDWICAIEDYFGEKLIPDRLQCKMASYTLVGEAESWWKQLKHDRSLEGKLKISSWTRMKHLLAKRFMHGKCSTKCPEQIYSTGQANENHWKQRKVESLLPTKCSIKCPSKEYISTRGENRKLDMKKGFYHASVTEVNAASEIAICSKQFEDEKDSFQRDERECYLSDYITARIRMKIQLFNGTASNLVDWVDSVEDFFVHMDIPEELKSKIASYAMEGEAEHWWQLLQRDRLKVGESNIYSWEKMKHIMLNVFLPTTCLIKAPSEDVVYDNENVNENFVEEEKRQEIEGQVQPIGDGNKGDGVICENDIGGSIKEDDLSERRTDSYMLTDTLITEITVEDQEPQPQAKHGVHGNHYINTSGIGHGVGAKVPRLEKEQTRKQTLWSSNIVDILVDESPSLFNTCHESGKSRQSVIEVVKLSLNSSSLCICLRQRGVLTRVVSHIVLYASEIVGMLGSERKKLTQRNVDPQVDIFSYRINGLNFAKKRYATGSVYGANKQFLLLKYLPNAHTPTMMFLFDPGGCQITMKSGNFLSPISKIVFRKEYLNNVVPESEEANDDSSLAEVMSFQFDPGGVHRLTTLRRFSFIILKFGVATINASFLGSSFVKTNGFCGGDWNSHIMLQDKMAMRIVFCFYSWLGRCENLMFKSWWCLNEDLASEDSIGNVAALSKSCHVYEFINDGGQTVNFDPGGNYSSINKGRVYRILQIEPRFADDVVKRNRAVSINRSNEDLANFTTVKNKVASLPQFILQSWYDLQTIYVGPSINVLLPFDPGGITYLSRTRNSVGIPNNCDVNLSHYENNQIDHLFCSHGRKFSRAELIPWACSHDHLLRAWDKILRQLRYNLTFTREAEFLIDVVISFDYSFLHSAIPVANMHPLVNHCPVMEEFYLPFMAQRCRIEEVVVVFNERSLSWFNADINLAMLLSVQGDGFDIGKFRLNDKWREKLVGLGSYDNEVYTISMPWYYLHQVENDAQHFKNLMRILPVTFLLLRIAIEVYLGFFGSCVHTFCKNGRYSRKRVKLFHDVVNGLDPPMCLSTNPYEFARDELSVGRDRDDVMRCKVSYVIYLLEGIYVF